MNGSASDTTIGIGLFSCQACEGIYKPGDFKKHKNEYESECVILYGRWRYLCQQNFTCQKIVPENYNFINNNEEMHE